MQPTHAGWYWDPNGRPGLFRWWDGVQWTRHVTPDRNDPSPAPFRPAEPDSDGHARPAQKIEEDCLDLIIRMMPGPAGPYPAAPDPSTPVAYGEYLVTAASCGDCHSLGSNPAQPMWLRAQCFGSTIRARAWRRARRAP